MDMLTVWDVEVWDVKMMAVRDMDVVTVRDVEVWMVAMMPVKAVAVPRQLLMRCNKRLGVQVSGSLYSGG